MTRPCDVPTFLTQVPLCDLTDGPCSLRSVTEKVSSTHQPEELIALDLLERQHCGPTSSLIMSQWQNQFLKTKKKKKKTKAPYNKSFGCASWYSSLELSHGFVTTSASRPGQNHLQISQALPFGLLRSFDPQTTPQSPQRSLTAERLLKWEPSR